MHPVQSICITCDTTHSLCGPCAMDALSSHSRVALACQNKHPGFALHGTRHHAHPWRQHHSAHEPHCSGCGGLAVRAKFAAPAHASPHAEALSLSIPNSWEEPPLESPRDWIGNLAPEIVKHVHEAPVFHLAYTGENQTKRKRVCAEDVRNPDSWPEIRRSMMDSNPDAVVFVQELDAEADADSSSTELSGSTDELAGVPAEAGDVKLGPRLSLSRSFNTGSKTWGLVVLGRSNRHSCYILQTSEVFSTTGATTHFSLTKAKCFSPSLHQQIERAWVVQPK